MVTTDITSRVRVLTALAHKEPDRVPLDFGASPVTGVAASTYIELKKALGINTPTRIEIGQQLAIVEEAVQQRVKADVRRIACDPVHWKEWTFNDGTTALIDAGARIEIQPDKSQHLFVDGGARIVMPPPPTGWFFDIVPDYQPLRNATTKEEVRVLFDSLPKEPAIEARDAVIKLARQRRVENQYATFGVFATAVFECWFYRGFDLFLTDLLADPDLAEYMMRIHAEHYLEFWRPLLEQIGPDLDVIFVSDDLGSQQCLLISEELYVEYVKPLHRYLWSEVKKLCPNARLFLHSCGAIEPLIPHFIELGVDILNPIQVSAKGMDPALLKKKYGRNITFWGGGVDTQSVLQRGTPQKVRDDVRRHIDAMAPGGGFVFAAVHDIQPQTPVANLMAMFEAVEEYGKY